MSRQLLIRVWTYVILLVVFATAGCVSTSSTSGYYLKSTEDARNGSTIRMKVGNELTVVLEDGYTWIANVGDQSLFEPVSRGRMRMDDVDATIAKIRAVRAGETAIHLEGEPNCKKGTPPCDAPVRIVDRKVIISE